jgi:uncharacterized membrane protein YphA (DoxX/SURF4 family)
MSFPPSGWHEFVVFLDQFNFPYPELMAPLSIAFQFGAGIAFILGLFTRWFGLFTAINFIVAVWMVHWDDPSRACGRPRSSFSWASISRFEARAATGSTACSKAVRAAGDSCG